MANSSKTKEQELMELGKKLEAFYDMGYVNKKEALKFTFLKGMISGLGAVLGATILIGLLIWILTQFSQVPVIGHFVHNVKQTIETNKSVK